MVPDDCIEVILAHRGIATYTSMLIAIGVSTGTAVVAECASNGFARGAVVTIAATLADQEPLKQGRHNCAPRREVFVVLKAARDALEHELRDDFGDFDLDPLFA